MANAIHLFRLIGKPTHELAEYVTDNGGELHYRILSEYVGSRFTAEFTDYEQAFKFKLAYSEFVFDYEVTELREKNDI